MMTFYQYLFESVKKEDYRTLHKNNYVNLKTEFRKIIEWVASIIETDKIERIDFAENTHCVAGIGKNARVKLFINGSRIARRNFIKEDILGKFKNGPLFFQTNKKGVHEFLYYANYEAIQNASNEVQDHKNVVDFSDFDQLIKFGHKERDTLTKLGGSYNAQYSIGYYRATGSLSSFKNLKLAAARKSNKILEKAEPLKIETLATIDFTIKDIGNNDKSQVFNANQVLDLLDRVLDPKKETKYTTYNKKIEESRSINSALRKPLEKDLDYEMYTSMFEFIAECAKEKDANLDSLKAKKIKCEETTFGNIIESYGGYGAVISEILVPFLLLAGCKTINGKEILELEKNDRVESIRFPTKSNEKLKDYDVVLANTTNGKTIAISAKFTKDSNHVSLMSLLHGCGNDVKFASKTLNILKTLKDTANNEIPVEFAKKLGSKLKDNPIKNNVTTLELVKAEANSKECTPKLCDKLEADYINKDKACLKEIYELVFVNFFGNNITFNQIELDRDLSVHVIKREERDDVSDLIEIKSSASKKENPDVKSDKISDYINIRQPLSIVLKRIE